MESRPDFHSLSNQELDTSLRALQQKRDQAAEVDRLQQVIEELQVHQIELEMHNRSLRELQTELEHSVQGYADLYDNLPIAYLTVSARGTIRAANRCAREWFQRDKRDLVGQSFSRFFDPYDAGRFAGHLDVCLHSSSPLTMEATLRIPHGDPVLAQLTSRKSPRAQQGEEVVDVAITDVSKLKESERLLQDINREQEAFNYSISHDLRAPLITISNYSGIVLADYGGVLGDEGRNMVQRIQCAAARMEAMLKRLLQYSALGREELVFEVVQPEQVITDVLVENRAVTDERRASIRVEKPMPPIRASAEVLNLVIANLLTNALKYTDGDKPPEITFSAEARAETVVIKVADRGIGIEPKYHERIFRIFERLHGYNRYPGSGVGLAIARRALERMRGRIWVESAPGQGSCFYVELPKA
jgi:PAS domain S-box-containing protein